jgi:hypothetical protein
LADAGCGVVKRSWYQQIKRSPASERTDSQGHVFDSKAELRRWEELKLLEKAGEISRLERQVVVPIHIGGDPVVIRSQHYPNGKPCKYTADFVYFQGNKRVWEEYKGRDDSESRFRRAVVEAIYHVEIIVTGPASSKTPRKRAA